MADTYLTLWEHAIERPNSHAKVKACAPEQQQRTIGRAARLAKEKAHGKSGTGCLSEKHRSFSKRSSQAVSRC